MFADKLRTDPMRISMDNTSFCAGEVLSGTITIDKQIWTIANNMSLDDYNLCMQFHGVERTAKATKVLVCQQVYLRLVKETSTTTEYHFEHKLDKQLVPSVSFHDHKIVYQVAVRFENASLDPRLTSKMPINILAPSKSGEVSNNLYNIVVPDLVASSKSSFNIKAVNPKFSNITGVEYKLIGEGGKTVYKNQVKLKGWNPEVDPTVYLQDVAQGKYLMKLSVKDTRTTSKFEIPVLVHEQDFLPAYTA
ncbi:hypothetical protein CJU89_3505 [Yarrowia sp. B02]|nr:hypothetical protein CJU89_3505 [Yarrowia sp. B02]